MQAIYAERNPKQTKKYFCFCQVILNKLKIIFAIFEYLLIITYSINSSGTASASEQFLVFKHCIVYTGIMVSFH